LSWISIISFSIISLFNSISEILLSASFTYSSIPQAFISSSHTFYFIELTISSISLHFAWCLLSMPALCLITSLYYSFWSSLSSTYPFVNPSYCPSYTCLHTECILQQARASYLCFLERTLKLWALSLTDQLCYRHLKWPIWESCPARWSSNGYAQMHHLSRSSSAL